MRSIKKILGLVWIILGPVLLVFMCWQAWQKISQAVTGPAKTNTTLQWGIILLIFIPVCIGLVIFGWYAWKNEYAELPQRSVDL